MIARKLHSTQFLQLLLSFWLGTGLVFACSVSATAQQPHQGENSLAEYLLNRSEVSGGFAVHVGCGDGQLTAALRKNERYMVHGLSQDAKEVQRAREEIRKRGLYGKVSVAQYDGKRLPYVDNLVNLLVVSEPNAPAEEEMKRVLVPNGVALIYRQQVGSGDLNQLWRKIVKQRPKNIDDWSHYLHDATGNPVAHDDVVGPPRHLQWVGSPRWSRHHDRMASMSAMVSAGGRMFYIMDEGSRVSIQLPSDWKLIARDAFNGTVLWKQNIKQWHNQLWPLKSGPTQLARRLVATKEHVYATLSLEAPVSQIDAATGKVLQTYEESASTEEIIHSDGLLFLLVNREKVPLAKYAPQLNVGDQARIRRDWKWNEKQREIMAIETESGKVLWKHKTTVSPLTLSADAKRVVFHNGKEIVSLNRSSGETLWQSEAAPRRASYTMNAGPRLILYQSVVLFAGGERTMQGYDIETGKRIWQSPHSRGGYESPEDLMVAGGLVWAGSVTSGRDSGIMVGRDPLTGELKSEFPPNVNTYWFHHRCYIGKGTDKFLLPSRTGIEFVDHSKKDWEIHHWVRGGCLYGIMPCNGLVYAPSHNCACYPEAKLYGMNALAPTSKSRKKRIAITDDNRLTKGPAFGNPIESKLQEDWTSQYDWPTYRRDNRRSGFTKQTLSSDLKESWKTKLGGKLTAPVIAEGKLFVAQIDQHTLYAIDETTGRPNWHYTAGGRIDSPPTIAEGHVLFGSADGNVYALRASDGELIWRYQAAPTDLRTMAYEQLESLWPVSGSVLVQDDVVSLVAGRSNYLDGGLRFLRLNLRTGEKLSETVIDEKHPEDGKNIQKEVQVLNMPVGLPDVLSSDGKHIYMRSQVFNLKGERTAISPHSGAPPEQGSVQKGETAHLFSPTGFLDGSWFHRSYWVYGRSFAGGHSGYHQAGKYAPSGRLLVFDDNNVYGFGRKPQYYRWTTTLEHQLFSARKEQDSPRIVEELSAGKGTVISNPLKKGTGKNRNTSQGKGNAKGNTKGKGNANTALTSFEGTIVTFPKTKSLSPINMAITVSAWVKSDRPAGVVVAHGGPAQGYALYFVNGKPTFGVRVDSELYQVQTVKKWTGEWVHLTGMFTAQGNLKLFVNGNMVKKTATAPKLITVEPVQPLDIGADSAGSVGQYPTPSGLTGLIDEVRVFHGELSDEEVKQLVGEAKSLKPAKAEAVLHCSFNAGDARDATKHENHGRILGAQTQPGKNGKGMKFTGRTGRRPQGGYFVKHHWTEEVPLLVRAMVLADETLFIAGPPDVMNEEETFQRLVSRDPKVQELLSRQNAALEGSEGGVMMMVSAKDGKLLRKVELNSLPVWDGMAITNEKLYLVTTDGQIRCFTEASQ